VPLTGRVEFAPLLFPWLVSQAGTMGTKPKRAEHKKLRGAAILSDHAWSEIATALRITPRELQIVQGVFDNLTQKQVASRLSMHEHTAHTHLNRLFKKLNVTTRTELVLRVIEQLIALTIAETGVLPPICRRHQAGLCCAHKLSASPQRP